MPDTTMLADLINPEVMADMISAKIPTMIVVTPFAKIDDTLVGRPGNTVTVPRYAYIGDAEDVAEGVACGTTKLETSTGEATIKKAMKAVELTDEAVLSGYGDPVGETNGQLAKSIASKMDVDSMDALYDATLEYDGSDAKIAYIGIVNAVDIFDEEFQSDKVIFVHPKQVTQLRLDPDFISADKYDGKVMMTGEIGRVAGCRVVASKKVRLDDDVYICPVVKLNNEASTEDDVPALTIYRKRTVNVETERASLARKTAISADQIYGVNLSNEAKVVLAKFAAA